MDEYVYVYQKYPRWKYHPTQDACIVNDEEQESALGSEWVDSPVQVTADDSSKVDDSPKTDNLFDLPKKPRGKRA